MKAAPRIDAAAVDLEDTPTVKNPQCTGCHQLLDPIAGMYLNEDECGYEDTVFYQPPGSPKNNACPDRGWARPADIFPPGVGAGMANALSVMDRPRALEVLGAHVATQRGFARSMTVHVATSSWGRPLLVPPTDTSLPIRGPRRRRGCRDDGARAPHRPLHRRWAPAPSPRAGHREGHGVSRAGNADAIGRVGAASTGLGGGSLVTPEVLDPGSCATHWASSGRRTAGRRRETVATNGWAGTTAPTSRRTCSSARASRRCTADDGSVLGVKTRSRAASSLTAAIIEHLALEASCIAVTRDFDLPAAQRKLFPRAEKTLVPTGVAATDTAVLETLRDLHQQLLGARVTLDSADVQELYTLLRDVRRDGAAAVMARTEPAALERPCANDVVLSTGLPATGTTRDDAYVLRAWQAVIATLLLYRRFTLEEATGALTRRQLLWLCCSEPWLADVPWPGRQRSARLLGAAARHRRVGPDASFCDPKFGPRTSANGGFHNTNQLAMAGGIPYVDAYSMGTPWCGPSARSSPSSPTAIRN